MFTQKIHHQEPGNKGDCPISEPHQGLVLTVSHWQRQSSYLEPEVITKSQKIKVVTRYQNLIKSSYLQKVVTENQKFIKKNQKIKVITRYQNLVKIRF